MFFTYLKCTNVRGLCWSVVFVYSVCLFSQHFFWQFGWLIFHWPQVVTSSTLILMWPLCELCLVTWPIWFPSWNDWPLDIFDSAHKCFSMNKFGGRVSWMCFLVKLRPSVSYGLIWVHCLASFGFISHVCPRYHWKSTGNWSQRQKGGVDSHVSQLPVGGQDFQNFPYTFNSVLITGFIFNVNLFSLC